MFSTFLAKARLVLGDQSLLFKMGFVVVALVVFRFLAAIPVPGVDALRLEQFFSNNQFLGLLNVFSGGGLANLSIVMLGVGPYITASIIMQLLTIMAPSLKAMYQEEGELGRKKFSQYSRLLSVPLAFMQGYAFLFLLEKQGIVSDLSFVSMAVNVLV
ncbi:MAG TPA: preprotein translocase subunit SecY, partial [Candidatus Paceibacterota bacterium]